VEDADRLVLLVDHQKFREITPHELVRKMRGSVIIDTRGIWLSNEQIGQQSLKNRSTGFLPNQKDRGIRQQKLESRGSLSNERLRGLEYCIFSGSVNPYLVGV